MFFFFYFHSKMFYRIYQLPQQLQMLHSFEVLVLLPSAGCQTSTDSAWIKPENDQHTAAAPGRA